MARPDDGGLWYVMSKRGDTEENFIEATRTSKKAAEQDVQLLKDVGHRHAWIREEGNK